MSSLATVEPGDVIAGKYRIERVLGAGGMGYVVAARHLQLDQLVAMKFLRTDALDSTEASARFLREAKAVVKLRNEHVAKVFDVGTLESGDPYIVMEHLDGCDLAELAKQRHAISIPEACEYVMQACEALAEAHSLGIVHRDIKLANLFVTRGPTGGPLVKVLDFGISKTNPFGESEHDMTRTSSMLGSPRFMSPEQMRDPRAVDGRSDLWSLGVVLYRLVAGHPPFEADTLGRLLTMVMHEPFPPLASVRNDLPPGFEQVVARCLEKAPEKRFANVSDLAHALAPFSADPSYARSAADRVAAVLGHTRPGKESSFPLTSGSSSLASGPHARSSSGDTGAAASWGATHDGSVRTRGVQTVGLGLGFAAMLVGAFLFALARRHHEPTVASPRAATEVTGTASASALPASSPVAPSSDTAAADPISTSSQASPVTIPSPPTTTRPEGATSPRRTNTPSPQRSIKALPTRPFGGPGPATSDEGIPATRD